MAPTVRAPVLEIQLVTGRTSMTAQVLPTRSGERFEDLDYVRGLALLGIFIMNLPTFALNSSAYLGAGIPGATWWDQAAFLFTDILLSGKFNSMFSMLFAIGFTLQLERLEASLPASEAAYVYLRRLAVLLLMGAVHMLFFWTGDILHVYALLGFLLLWLRRWSDRGILALALGCIFLPSVVRIWQFSQMSPQIFQQTMAVARSGFALDDSVFGHGGFLQAVHRTFYDAVYYYTAAYLRPSLFAEYMLILTTMCLGLLIGRRGWYRNVAVHLPVLARWRWILLAVGLVTGCVVALEDFLYQPQDGLTALGLFSSVCYRLCRLSLTAFYVLCFLMLLQRPVWRERLRPMAVAGRMALTNYLVQTAFGLVVFYGWGFGLRGHVGAAGLLVICCAFYGLVQLPLSCWWLRRYEFGPFEYLWRAATYGRLPPFRARVTA